MTDSPPGSDPLGDEDRSYEPSGVQRSTFTPRTTDASAPSFDDDALADAMAAEVAAYTAPLTLPGAIRSTTPPTTAPPVAPAAASGSAPPASGPVPTPVGGSTLEAIERLEEELRRLTENRPESPVPPAISAPQVADDEAPELDDDPGESSGPIWDLAPTPDDSPPPLVEPPAFAPARFDSAPIDPPPLSTPPSGSPEIDPGFGDDFSQVDISKLPPPVGLEPAVLPPYRPDAVGTPSELPPDPGESAVPNGDILPFAPSTGSVTLTPGVTTPATEGFEALFGTQETFPDPSEDEDDVVDEVDRVFGTGAIAVDSTGAVEVVSPPSRPIATMRLTPDEPALVDEHVQQHPVFTVESAGQEPTALDLRAGRASRLFWLWFATTSSLLSVTIGATLFELGMSLRQSVVATLAGVAISFLPLGLGTLAGKWSGQPTMVVSRASFGLRGNILPVLLAIISRAFWGGALLWILAITIGAVLTDSGLDAGLGREVWTIVGLLAGFAIATVVAVCGYGFIARIQLVLGIVAAILIVGVIALTWDRLDLPAALTVGDGPWILVVTGAVIVFSFVGLAWVHSSGDLARYQRPGSLGATSVLWATFGATLPAFLLIGWGAMLAASDAVLADGLTTAPLRTIAALLPIWYPAPLIIAAGAGLLSGAILTIYSGGFALQALGIQARRSLTTLLAAVLALAAAAALVFLVPDARALVRDVATTIAVPVAAWAGIFAAEMMIRNRRFDSSSLLAPGGVYPLVRWGNLIGLVVISAVGFGLTAGTLPWLSWQGFLMPLLGVAPDDPLATSDVGVFAALALGILLPLVTAVRAIRRQEQDRVESPS